MEPLSLKELLWLLPSGGAGGLRLMKDCGFSRGFGNYTGSISLLTDCNIGLSVLTNDFIPHACFLIF